MIIDPVFEGSSFANWAAYFPFKKDKGIFIFRSPTPFITARNQVPPFLLAYTAISPISNGGKTMVSSHIDGMLLMISTAGLARSAFGLAA